MNDPEKLKEQLNLYFLAFNKAMQRIKDLEGALQKIADIEDEHINAPKTDAEANLWTCLAMCVDIAQQALDWKGDEKCPKQQ